MARNPKTSKSKLPRLIGVLHLPPLPGCPGLRGQAPSSILQKAGLQAIQEAKLLLRLGYDGLIIENFGDVPFYKNSVPPETVASMAVISAAVKESVSIPVGINVLRNDAFAALSIAAVTGADFIRVNVLSGIAATDQGMIEGQADKLLRERDRLNIDIKIFADVHVKHAKTLSSDDIGIAIEDAVVRSLADAVIVTGETTGRSVSLEQLRIASATASKLKTPLYIGSGATPENLETLKPLINGVIIGSFIRKNGKAGSPVDSIRAKKFVKAFKTVRG